MMENGKIEHHMAMEQITIGLSIALNRLLFCEGARKLIETDDVVAIVKEDSNGNEAASHYDQSHVPSVRVDQTLQDQTEGLLGAGHSVSFWFSCIPLRRLR
jgi:hypothetical protein